ncbi:hypothetical protein LSH36_181g03013 [Paralvinella palmiformis]|uniref:J domain-containing protein n=1 Tax=Paralvinella palmiformis TaxID=53620 RepID=A0AAD9N8E5_9ANNE|nr:hypothetical protein LSH36_181g03013 [Paralvinella palmiformis]
MASSTDDDLDLVDGDDYYAWLGLSKNASKDEINNAFRRFSRMYHPDKHASDAALHSKAETIFPKIKKAHDVLSDPQKRAIYDTMGVKGLETDGWEIVSRTKTPQEILEEYERLAREREKKLLEQKTNPKGTFSIGIDASDMFDRYHAIDAMEYSSSLPNIEINEISISQSIECPLTTKNTAIIAGNLASRNGRGQGQISVTGRRLVSDNGWAEVELSAGDGTAIIVRGFRTLWRRAFGTMSGSLQFTPHGRVSVLKPAFSSMVAMQLDKNVQGRITYNWGTHSSMTSMIIYDTDKRHIVAAVQIGLPNTLAMISYTHKFLDDDMKLKGSLRVGTFGVVAEYGCEKQVTKFSTLGATVSIGIPIGVILKLKMNRGNQIYMIPIHLADEIVPNAIFYGTFLPVATYFAVKLLIVNPFLKDQKEKELQKKKEANATRLITKQREAESAVELMKQTVDRIRESEERKGGLIIKKALYGKLEGESLTTTDYLTVTLQVQSLVNDSRLLIPEGTHMSELPGFYDPCIGEAKELSITYEFRRRLHICLFKDGDRVLLPNRDHLAEQPPSSAAASDGLSR